MLGSRSPIEMLEPRQLLSASSAATGPAPAIAAAAAVQPLTLPSIPSKGATVNISGTWVFHNDDVFGDTDTFVFTETHSGALTGTFSSNYGQTGTLTGQVSGSNVSFTWTDDAPDNGSFTGTVNSAGTQIVGSWDNAGAGVIDPNFTMVGQQPAISFVTAPDSNNMFWITPAPSMPTISVALTGLPSDVSADTPVTWNASIAYTSPDGLSMGESLPASQGQAGSPYTLNFQSKSLQIMGGNLTVTATFTENGQSMTLSTADQQSTANVSIGGQNPTVQAINAYVQGKGIPALAVGSKYSFTSVVDAIIEHESSDQQFDSDGNPLYNGQGDGGVGLMQLTGNNRNTRDFWNWQTDIDDGFSLLAGNLTQAKNHFSISARNPVTPEIPELQREYMVSSIAFQTPTATDLVENAISLFGPNSRYYEGYVDANGQINVSVSGKVGTVLLDVIPNNYVTTILNLI